LFTFQLNISLHSTQLNISQYYRVFLFNWLRPATHDTGAGSYVAGLNFLKLPNITLDPQG